jgi:hypothetical protein
MIDLIRSILWLLTLDKDDDFFGVEACHNSYDDDD